MIPKEEITKEHAIAKFKQLCSEDFTKRQRQENIGTQTYRNHWKLVIQNIEFVIFYKEDFGRLNVYDACGYIDKNNRRIDLVREFTITREEYLELKKHYYGEFTVDSYYMEEISALTAQYQNIKKADEDEEAALQHQLEQPQT